jgi:hypothetical protein
LHNVPITTGTAGGTPGILGYDFFLGRIVHIDYEHKQVDVYPRLHFTPPSGAVRIPVDYREGAPIITARVGGATAHRFLLDTGSPHLVLSYYLEEHDGHTLAELRLTAPPGAARVEDYVGGGIMARKIDLGEIAIGPFVVSNIDASLEERSEATINDTIEIPFDGIIGTDVMSHFEWWFDYDGAGLWLRPRLR